ncbi:MAG: hypothetical protein KatS3mg131_3390 [Candidatus Tectimicrobiota bacterium]|nr:MAG: hypothetical protein KatS3mg131_3390 [Candidatus Tectomicrobia bacterium]
MLYMVECGFADAAQEAAWNAWYGETKLAELLAVPGFLASQRFRALDDAPAPYLAIHSIASAAVFTHPAYRRGGGGGFGPWDPALITDWRRRLFTGLDVMPAVAAEERLVVYDGDPQAAPPLGLRFAWLAGVDWGAVTTYRAAVALDASVPHRGVAIVDAPTAAALPALPGLRRYRPLGPRRVASENVL